MGAFDLLRIAGSSLGMHQTWLDALANNIANVNTIKATNQNAFQAQMVVAGARSDGGVQVDGVAQSDAAGPPVGLKINDQTSPTTVTPRTTGMKIMAR